MDFREHAADVNCLHERQGSTRYVLPYRPVSSTPVSFSHRAGMVGRIRHRRAYACEIGRAHGVRVHVSDAILASGRHGES